VKINKPKYFCYDLLLLLKKGNRYIFIGDWGNPMKDWFKKNKPGLCDHIKSARKI